MSLIDALVRDIDRLTAENGRLRAANAEFDAELKYLRANYLAAVSALEKENTQLRTGGDLHGCTSWRGGK